MQASMTRSAFEITTFDNSEAVFLPGLTRARVTLEVDPRSFVGLMSNLPAFIEWPEGMM